MPSISTPSTNSPEDYFQRKVANKIYISKRFENKNGDESVYYRRSITEIFDTVRFVDYIKVKDEILLRIVSNSFLSF